MTERNHTKQARSSTSPEFPPLNKKKTKSKKGYFHRDMTTFNIVVAILTVLANIGVVFVMFNTTQFAGLGKIAFIVINVLVLILLIIVDFVVILGIRTKKQSIYMGGIIAMAVFLAIGGYGSYALIRVNFSLGKMTGSTVTESVSTSLVVYGTEGASEITEIGNLDGRIIGYANGTNTATLGQNQIDAAHVTVSYEQFQDYSTEILALFAGEIDCAILPSNYLDMFKNEDSMSDLLANTTSIGDFTDTVKTTVSSGAEKDITSQPFTVLLMGTADGLSDTMILCSINPISMKFTMTSIPRDAYVPITCYNGGSSKLNAAHSVSVDCTINTIEQLTGVEIDYYVDTNFQGVVDVINALGGIVIDYSPLEFVGQDSSSERGHYTVLVPAGENVVMNGEQALAFARERHAFATGDFAREEHQQEVIKSMMRSIMRTRDVNTLLNVLEAAGDNISTNLSISQMVNFLSYAIQKTNRYYDTTHVENIFQIENFRITGYNSSKWDEGSGILLSIVRLWNSAISAAKTEIDRNTNLDSPISYDTSRIKWSVNWEYTVPQITYDSYAEQQVAPESAPEGTTTESACAVGAHDDGTGNCVCDDGLQGDAWAGGCFAGTGTSTPTPIPTEGTTSSEETNCTSTGGTWDGYSCSYPTQAPTPTPEIPAPTPQPTATAEPPAPTSTPTTTAETESVGNDSGDGNNEG